MRGPLISACMTIVAVLVIAAAAGAGIVGVDVAGSAYTGPGVLDTSSRTWELKPSTGDTFLLDGQPIDPESDVGRKADELARRVMAVGEKKRSKQKRSFLNAFSIR